MNIVLKNHILLTAKLKTYFHSNLFHESAMQIAFLLSAGDCVVSLHTTQLPGSCVSCRAAQCSAGNSTTLPCTSMQYTKVQVIFFHCIELQCTALYFIACITVKFSAVQ